MPTSCRHGITITTVAAAILFQISSQAATNELELAIWSFPKVAAPKYRPDLAARSANILISAGSNSACAVLESLAKLKPGTNWTSDEVANYDSANRAICYLCRLLFSSNVPSEPLRPPRLGACQGIPYNSMSAEDWPDLPFAIVDKIPVSLIQGYVLGGVPEAAESYLAYCRNNGVFRTGPYAQATRESATHALRQLFSSSAWRKLKWKDNGRGWSYDINEEFTKEVLLMQAERIPQQ